MDTAQRGMGLDWPTSLELIRRSVSAAKARGGALLFSGAGTDHLAPEAARTRDDVIRAYEEQVAAIEAVGGRIILMASRALARIARDADDYAAVYGRILRQLREPAIIHWLGDMFDPALAGYWGSAISMPRWRPLLDHRCRRRQGRRHQDFAARQAAGDRDAAAPAPRASACIRAMISTMPS